MINGIPGMGAFHSFGLRQQVAAHNVANVNTRDFEPSRVILEEAGNRQGVRPQTVENVRDQALEHAREMQDQAAAEAQERALRPSNTDLISELVLMQQNETAYAANAAAVRTRDDMLGHVINMTT